MIIRLPTPGADDGTWGNVLNDFLGVEHNADGTLKNTRLNSILLTALPRSMEAVRYHMLILPVGATTSTIAAVTIRGLWSYPS